MDTCHFLSRLNLDVRLNIYGHCDAQSLGRLEQTCRQVHDEILPGPHHASPWKRICQRYANKTSTLEMSVANIKDSSRSKSGYRYLAERHKLQAQQKGVSCSIEPAPECMGQTCFATHAFGCLP